MVACVVAAMVVGVYFLETSATKPCPDNVPGPGGITFPIFYSCDDAILMTSCSKLEEEGFDCSGCECTSKEYYFGG